LEWLADGGTVHASRGVLKRQPSMIVITSGKFRKSLALNLLD